MALVTITQAAKLAGISKQTLYRHVKTGRVSRRSDSMLDTTELIRIYGELKQVDAVTSNKTPRPLLRTDTNESDALRGHIETLQKDLLEIKQQMEQHRIDSVDREKRLMALLEHKIDTPQTVTNPVEAGGFFGKLFK
jgi:hypothetical protein